MDKYDFDNTWMYYNKARKYDKNNIYSGANKQSLWFYVPRIDNTTDNLSWQKIKCVLERYLRPFKVLFIRIKNKIERMKINNAYNQKDV